MRPLPAGIVWVAVALLTVVGRADEARLAVVGDTSLQAHPSEVTFNSGASSGIRIKGNEHFMLMKFDLAPIRGWEVERATLYLHAVHEHKLRTVGLSTISADWEEGAGRSQQVDGGCTFTRAVWPDRFWAGPDSDFTNVSLTNGNTRTFYTDIAENRDNWLLVEVDPWLVHAMMAGASYGLCLSDEKGQTRANNDVHSREQNAFRPYMIVEGAPPADLPAPPALGEIRAQPWPPAATFRTGALRIAVTSPQAFRYEVWYRGEGDEQKRALPRYLTPHPAAPGQLQLMMIPGLEPGGEYVVEAGAVDKFGRRGELQRGRAKASQVNPLPEPLQKVAEVQQDGREPQVVNGLRIWACPAECKVSPISGNVLEEVGRERYESEPAGVWRRGNPVWDGREAHLSAARGEVIALQIVVENLSGEARQVALDCAPGTGQGGFPEPVLIARNWYVRDGQWYAEYVVPVGDGPTAIPAVDNGAPGQANQSFTLIWEAPRDIQPGLKRFEIRVKSDQTQTLPVTVHVRNMEIPAKTSFEVDLNCYGPVHRDADFDEYLQWERGYYAAAHALRATLNPLPYSQSGKTYRGFVPELAGQGANMRVAEWGLYDRHYGPCLDGSAFEGVRAGIPVTHMYLPLHENWPSQIADHYSAGNDIKKYNANIIEHALTAPAVEAAFAQEFKDAFVAVTRQFVEHFGERGWDSTDLQCYQNNKYYYKDEKHGFRGTSWWLLDEPMHRDDFLALRFFAHLYGQGAGEARRFIYRGDISRPQWQRDWLDGLVDVVCVSSALFSHGRHCRRMKDQWGVRFWHYGTANPVHASNLSGEAWALKAYLAGADGILPWNCIGGDGAFTTPTATALLVPGGRFDLRGPVISLRLLALCRGQQDVEYLNLLAKKRGYDREQMARLVGDFLRLAGAHRMDYAEDAGRLEFGRLSWGEFANLREAVARGMKEES